MEGGGCNMISREDHAAAAAATTTVTRKGPWMAEEDEILVEYVRSHGPRDWSSIRSKGLLPRTGKSCRLRWVNKLKPDLKTGCKFSTEEERVVIDLQAQLGNKWARIATHLPGRTDNDVKNFWSTRQKRLARLLRAPLPPRPQRNHGKLYVPCRTPAFTDSNFDHISFEVELSNGQCNQCSSTGMALPLMEPVDTEMKPLLSSSTRQPELPFDRPPLPPLELPLLLEGRDLIPGLGDDEFARHEGSECLQLTEGLPFPGQLGVKAEDVSPGILDGFFDELPADMFDYLDPPPAATADWQCGCSEYK